MSQLLYKERGGVRIGQSSLKSFNATWPLAKLSIFDDGIIIKYPFKSVKISKSDISQCIQFQGTTLMPAVQFIHNSTNTPFIMFWTKNVLNLLTQLKNAGYPTQ